LAAVWQVEHFVGADPPSNRNVPGVPWQDWQNPRSLFASRPWKAALEGLVQVAPRMCGVVSAPWHRVLLKHPGGVPAGAGVAGSGCPAGLFGDPGKWHAAQTGALATFVLSWLVPPAVRHGAAGWGALIPLPWQAALLKQETPDPPPAKLFPWQIRHDAKPEAPGARFAEAPWTAACDHVRMVP
jgi:hypothetical protein